MWKLKLRKLYLFTFVFLLFSASVAFSQEDLSNLEEFQELANNLSMESYKQEMTQIKSLTSLLLQELQQNPQQIMDKSLVESLKNCEQKMKSSEYQQMPLSEQLKVINESQKLSNQLTQVYLQQQTTLSNSQLNALKITNDLLQHYKKLLEILQKIIQSQNDDVKTAIEQIRKTNEDAKNVKIQLETALILANKQAEEIEALKKKINGLKRARITSACIFGGGLLVTGIGTILKQNDNTKDIGNVLAITGATAMGSGLIIFGFSITIPF